MHVAKSEITMSLAKRYDPKEAEPRLSTRWQELGVYHFPSQAKGPVYSIDTPPATVSGRLHLGHTYSYSHPDFIARYWRMKGYQVFYPMGYDDNGLPTERLVEKRLGISAAQAGRTVFIEKCLEVSEQAEEEYQALWQRLGLSIDWRYTYRTIDAESRRISQRSFIDLYRKGLAYRGEAPAIWCPECHTALAQADLNDLERESEYVYLKFIMVTDCVGDHNEQDLLIATTRPELLPACVAVFVHPDDARYQGLVGRKLRVPLFGQEVGIIADASADPQKGSGAVMCCTFGDAADVAWQRKHNLPVVQAIGANGAMTQVAGVYAGLTIAEARRRIKDDLAARGLVNSRQATHQVIRVHERCDTPVEYVMARQWFIRLLDRRDELLQTGQAVNWHPEHMQARYRAWVEGLNWDWCISRQRTFGVPFPVWYCQVCGRVILADEEQLPVDPNEQRPRRPCACGGTDFIPDPDVQDTWATSSLTPQIVGRWLEANHNDGPRLYEQVFPFSLRPQAHEIIRTWAFYTLAKSHYHFGCLPWKDTLISGWGIAGEGMGKISKSRGGGPMAPMEMINQYSADALRYWASSTGPGKDAVISPEKIQMGARLVTKLWNVAKFSERFLTQGGKVPAAQGSSLARQALTPADRWILARSQQLIRRASELMESYDYAAAKAEIEAFFWRDLADNYLEMAKQRLYDEMHPQHLAGQMVLKTVLLTTLKLFAPFLPFVTEEIYLGLFAPPEEGNAVSIHTSSWPSPEPELEDAAALALGETLIEIATAVRRYKSEHSLPLGSEVERLELAANSKQWAAANNQLLSGSSQSPAPGNSDFDLQAALEGARVDLMSITRARQIEVVDELDPALERLEMNGTIRLALQA